MGNNCVEYACSMDGGWCLEMVEAYMHSQPRSQEWEGLGLMGIIKLLENPKPRPNGQNCKWLWRLDGCLPLYFRMAWETHIISLSQALDSEIRRVLEEFRTH